MSRLWVLQITKMFVYSFLFSLSPTHSIPFFLYFYILFLIDLNKLLHINLKITVEHSSPKKYTFMYNFSLQITKSKIYQQVSDGTWTFYLQWVQVSNMVWDLEWQDFSLYLWISTTTLDKLESKSLNQCCHVDQ